MNYRQPFRGTYPITQRYGEHIDGITVGGKHTGIDYACPVGTPILASADGQVMFAGSDPTGYGLCVIIRHNDGNATLYAHLSRLLVKGWQTVKQSDVIAESGNTGKSTGPHLHFEARKSWAVTDSHFDPMLLPLQSFADYGEPEIPQEPTPLKDADRLGESVRITAPAGAWGWSQDFGKRQTVFPCGTALHFTGRTTRRLGYTYCEVYPEPAKYWVAVNDGETQILDNSE